MKTNQVKVKKKVVKKRKKSLNIVHIFAIMFLVYFGYTFCNQQLALNKYNSQIEMYENEIHSKKYLVEYYNNENKNISTDEYIENVAREKLGLVKPYETVYVDANK